MSKSASAGPDAASLAPTVIIDSDHPAVIAFAREHDRGADVRERAVSLYLAVRDGFRYDPYRIDLSPRGVSASAVLANGYGWCVPKAALLTAACRAVGIPSRVGYADVRNHLSTERLRKAMNSDVYVWHGYSDIWIDGRWVKAAAATRSTTPSTRPATATWSTSPSAASSMRCLLRPSSRTSAAITPTPR
jgi:transglutaminase-like putative cysteine protease